MMNRLLEKLYNDVCLDPRVDNGAFDVLNNEHVSVMREYLVKKGIAEADAREFCNLVVEKGKHPERQAYNKDGILVTFPSREYKQRAIKRGTHFDKDPTKGRTTLFQEPDKEKAAPSDADKEEPKDTGGGGAKDISSLPPSDVADKETPPGPGGEKAPEKSQAVTTTAPSPDATTDNPIQAEPPPADVQPPKPAKEKEQDRVVIKKIVMGGNTGVGLPDLGEIQQIRINLPVLTERKDSVVSQLRDLLEIAEILGMKDAAMAIKRFVL